MTGKTEQCIKRLQRTVNNLLRDGIDPVSLMVSLAFVAIDFADRDERHAVTHIESLPVFPKQPRKREARAIMFKARDEPSGRLFCVTASGFLQDQLRCPRLSDCRGAR